MTAPVSLGPWMGIDNVHETDASAFQIPGPREQRLATLATAMDVDLDDDGWPATRRPAADVLDFVEGRRGVSFGGALILQDMGRLARVDPVTRVSTGLVSGLVGPAEFCKHAGQLFWTDGTSAGRLDAALVPRNWGCAICPTPTLTVGGGQLPAGAYMIAAEFKDASGIIHAADEAASGVLAATGGIIVSIFSFDPSATHVRLYLAGPDDDVLYMSADVPVGSFPYTITDLPTEDTTCWTIGLSPPPPHDFAFAYGDRLMLVDGQWIYPSVGAAAHLYDIGLNTTTVARPETILAGGGLPDGFWTVSAKGAYWCSGEQIENWRTQDRKESVEFCTGSFVVNTADIPGLRIDPTPAVLFWCRWGLAIGLPGGSMIFPKRSSYNMAVTGKTARFTLHDDGSDLKQFFAVVG